MTLYSMSILSKFFLLILTQSLHPLKASILILILALASLMYMSYTYGMMFVTIIASMLFCGGIIIMFMILSSMQPNLESGQERAGWSFKTFAFLVLALTQTQSTSPNNMKLDNSTLTVFDSWATVVIVFCVVYMFYSLFLMALKTSSESSLRATS